MSWIRFELSWLAPPDSAGGADKQLLELLSGIRAKGTIAAAASAARISYRHAWGTLGRWERLLGQRVVVLERGRGATLAPLGERLLEADLRVRKKLEPAFARLATELERELAAFLETRPVLRVVASHDLALLQLRELAADRGLPMDLQVRGSSEALSTYSRGDCDFAGFHLSTARPDLDLRKWLDPRRDALVHFAVRRQGLMLRRGNPKRIHGVGDLVRPSVRFVNRQVGSGTRVLFDRLLADAGVKPRQVRGYSAEEYTHLAVAATVASGMADAGFGIEAAAARHGLDFVPVETEEYLLACRLARLKAGATTALRKLMASAAFRRSTADLTGYDLSRSGKIVRFDAAAGPAAR